MPTHPVPSPYLARVQPVLQPVAPSDARQRQAVEDVLAQQAEQCAAQAQAEQHKETREMVDAHLEGLGWAEHRHKPFMITTDPREPWPGEERVGQRPGPGAVQLDSKVRASCYGARFHGREGTGAGG